jgi:hypothetical protein
VKAIILISTAVLVSAAAQADDASWILQPELTPARLAEDGAVLTASDSIRWPDGPSVDISYWLGTGDVVYRCAAMSASGVSNSSCWREQLVVSDATEGGRRISTRQRPVPTTIDPAQSVAIQPYVWMEGMRSPPIARPPGPRPTPLPAP